jgi:hypothetical protein
MMMTDQLLSSLALGIPNFLFAVLMYYFFSRTVTKLLDNQQKLVEYLLSLHPPADPASPSPAPPAAG